MLVQLVYISTCVGNQIDMDPEMFNAARARNIDRGIASVVLSNNIYYIHSIEGERDAVNKLYSTILRDTKHKNCIILRYLEISKKDFEDFSVAFARLSDFDTTDGNTVGSTITIDPETITSSIAMSLLRRVAAHHYAHEGIHHRIRHRSE